MAKEKLDCQCLEAASATVGCRWTCLSYRCFMMYTTPQNASYEQPMAAKVLGHFSPDTPVRPFSGSIHRNPLLARSKCRSFYEDACLLGLPAETAVILVALTWLRQVNQIKYPLLILMSCGDDQPTNLSAIHRGLLILYYSLFPACAKWKLVMNKKGNAKDAAEAKASKLGRGLKFLRTHT